MGIHETMAEAVAKGMRDGIEMQARIAEGAIGTLGMAYDTLHQKAGELSGHLASRPAVERYAIAEVMAMPVTEGVKSWSLTSAKDNLDLSERFNTWRTKRNELEGEVHYATSQIEVLKRTADLEIAMLRIMGGV